MKKIKTIVILLLTLLFPNLIYGQEKQREFTEILQTYYLHQDNDLVEKTLEFVNSSNVDYKRVEPILTGFFGALFSADTLVRSEFLKNSDKFQKNEFKQLFTFLTTTNIDSIYLKTPLTPSFNDMNWSSYFATGNVKYLDRIISNIVLSENRTDLNLFVTGASAKWSLCSNARQDKQVKEHLIKQKENKKIIKEILNKEPQEFKQEMKDVIAEQRANGLWK
jgi:hypothetical protein